MLGPENISECGSPNKGESRTSGWNLEIVCMFKDSQMHSRVEDVNMRRSPKPRDGAGP